jgi:dTDP-4-dehydrorhamnose reductase
MLSKNKPRILIVGSNGNLGTYLSQYFECDKFYRNINLNDYVEKAYDIIIYCASNTKNLKSGLLNDYYYDNYGLLQDVLKIQHQYLIYFSSVDVYPALTNVCLENSEIEIRDVSSPYGLFKLLSEQLIRKLKCNNSVIFRPTMMISPQSAKNNLKKIIEDERPVLSVSPDSEYNVISYFDVLNVVRHFISTRQTGIYNLASSKNIKLFDLASKLNKKVVWGKFLYKLNKIDIAKITTIDSAFFQTSEQIILDLYKKK